MATATVTREPVGAARWVSAALSKPVAPEDLIHELAEALEDEILAHPEVQEAGQKIHALLDRVEDLDPQLAGELGELIDLDHYCSVVRATLTAVLSREAVAA